MSFVIHTEAPPLREDVDGALRVGKSRVLLELVIEAFENGATPEIIAQQYSTLALSDIYSVIGYYLHHRSEVAEYLAMRDRQAEVIRKKIVERQGDMSGIRERLLARQRKAELEREASRG